ncbi:hypothetical protein EVAR_96177_1 [Eumeta japonica]|uniref:Uncharacterized protein n=1 Tax=Eumeta variegata TaxID=151549 RepID=A0A4C1VLE0_EUMVA|nr:hypothetical protein EVAR_96177_1 [Eumeta japonica]
MSQRFAGDDSNDVHDIGTRDGGWIYCYDPEKKGQGMFPFEEIPIEQNNGNPIATGPAPSSQRPRVHRPFCALSFPTAPTARSRRAPAARRLRGERRSVIVSLSEIQFALLRVSVDAAIVPPPRALTPKR